MKQRLVLQISASPYPWGQNCPETFSREHSPQKIWGRAMEKQRFSYDHTSRIDIYNHFTKAGTISHRNMMLHTSKYPLYHAHIARG